MNQKSTWVCPVPSLMFIVSDLAIKENILTQRLSCVLENDGFIEDIVQSLKNTRISDELNKLDDARHALKTEQEDIGRKIEELTKNLIDLQISYDILPYYFFRAFGRIEIKLDNQITTGKPDEDKDLEIVEPEGDVSLYSTKADANSWRAVQPSELVVGIRGIPGQAVLAKLSDGSWFPGKIAQICQQEDPDGPLASININQHLNIGGSPLTLNRSRQTPRAENTVRFLVNIDISPDQPSLINEINQKKAIVDSSAIALALSAEQLRQKYPVGSRVVSLYRDEVGGIGYYSGLVAEPPSERNSYRYLVFFDDGYAHYSQASEVFRIFRQTKDNWRETAAGSQDFIKRYLAQYPQRPMVRMKLNQTIKTELEGEWLQATVEKIDASLVLMRFSADHVEWIYRGSPRLEPLFNDIMVNRGSKNAEDMQRVVVDYANVEASLTCDGGRAERPKKRVSATGHCAARTMATSRSSSTAKSVAHRQKGVLAGAERRTSSLVSQQQQQQQTQQQLQQSQPRFEQPPEPLASQPSTQEAEETGKITFIKIADLSYGKENVPVPCVNCVDNETPTYVEYIAHRQPVGNVHINTDSDFLVCCDCTDNCRDRSKCACQQLTIEASSFTSARGLVDFSIGYRHRRLSQFTMGGIYECNKNCKCDRRCRNRVVQQGVWVRLQVFKTNRKGWGIRALNAIPKGSFICTYAGAIYDDNMAIDEGYGFGDEYQAELDYIETIEKPKEDYEPYAIEPSDSFDEYECASPASLPASSNTSRRNGGRRRRRRRRKSSSSCSSVSSSSRSSSLSIASSCVSCASSSCASFATSSVATNSEVIELDPVRSSSPGVDLDAAGTVEPSAGSKPPAGLRVASKLVRKADPVKSPRVNDLSTPTREAAPPNAAQEDLAPYPNPVQKADPLKPSQESDPPTLIEGADPPNDTHEVRIPSPNLVQVTDSMKVFQENDPTKPIDEADPPSAAQETHSPSPNFVQMADSLKDFQQNVSPTPIEVDSPKAAQETHSPSPNHVQMADSLDVFQENGPLRPITEADSPNAVQDVTSPNPNVALKADPSKLSSENDTVTLVEEVDPPNLAQEDTLPDPILIQEANALNPSQENDPTTPSDDAVPPDAAQEARSPTSVQESDLMLPDQESDTANFVQEDAPPQPPVPVAEPAAEVPLTSCVTPISDSNASSIHPDSPVSESRASTAEEDVESVELLPMEHDVADLAPSSPPEMTRMETSPSNGGGSSSPSVATLLENQLAELEPTISGLLANSRLLVPAFSTTAPGLSDCTGISNLREVLAEAAFNRLPFVRLSPLLDPIPVGGDSDNRHIRRRSLRSTNATPKPPSVRPPVIVQPATPSKTRETRSSLSISRKPTTVDHTQPRILLRINLRKNASAVLGRSSSTSSLVSLSAKSVDNEGRSSLSSGSRRAPSESRGGSRRSTSSRRANEQPSRERRGNHDHRHHHHHHHHHHQHQHHLHHSRSYIASASSSPAPPPTWANRRAYPIARKDWLLARNYFGDESPYVMDAKKMGNLGRYFNHSCNPNVFVQNVFIDTHDPRFPEVAFFAKRNIAAGEEMTWDYGYVVDAVPFKVLYCYCGEPSCRIRLL
nr:unnamed protein product [Spirometra erinaceieuropaei]